MNTAQASEAVSPIIDFAIKGKNRPKPARQIETPDHPDAALIEHCIKFGSHMKASDIAYEIDPTDSDFAAIADDKAKRLAWREMVGILDHPPTTMDGLRAKAAVLRIVIDGWDGAMEGFRQSFLESVADDVIRFQRASASLHQNHVPVQVPA